ncbi:hypothetical protein [Flavobacterium sp.]|jgi:hypothetical protein|uniref:hypothetical protein n=1 Tax=Flavobacterium sp. TaxID=239 RepID=UPI0037C14267
MTADRRADLALRVACEIQGALFCDVEPDTRAQELTDIELLALATAAIDLIRAEVLEEAARCAARQSSPSSWWIADAIRALKGKP